MHGRSTGADRPADSSFGDDIPLPGEANSGSLAPGSGDVLDGKYRVQGLLGAGSMGLVYLAQHLQLRTEVAIKTLHPALKVSREAVARFEREARAAARITSEHVARVMDVGTTPGGLPFMVMEHLRGGDLAQRLAGNGPLPLGEAVDYVLQACEALGEAHALGIVHRDLKPENLYCASRADGSCCLKVLDFGISKEVFGATMGAMGSVIGSPYYMSPEQIESPSTVDAQTDIWSLGVVLYELVGGTVPFLGETMHELWAHICWRSPVPLATLRGGLPAGFETVVARCLEKNRSRRFANVVELAAVLAPFAPDAGQARAATVARLMAPCTERRVSPSKAVAPPSHPEGSTASGTKSMAPFGRTAWATRSSRRTAALGISVFALATCALFVLPLRQYQTVTAAQRRASTARALAATVDATEPDPRSGLLGNLGADTSTMASATRVDVSMSPAVGPTAPVFPAADRANADASIAVPLRLRVKTGTAPPSLEQLAATTTRPSKTLYDDRK